MENNKNRVNNAIGGTVPAKEAKGKTYEQGVLDGRADGRRIEQLYRTRVHLNNLMNSTKMNLEEAMAALLLPRAERNTFRKIFANIQGLKKQAKK